MNPQDEALSVTQADRDSAFALDNAMSGGFLKPEERLAYLSGERDDWHNVQAFARHRLSHSTPGDAEVRGLPWHSAKPVPRSTMGYGGGVMLLDAAGACIGYVVTLNKSADHDPVVIDEAVQSLLLATPPGRAQGEVDRYREAVACVVATQRGSTSLIQRVLYIGYNSAARLVERMEADGILSKPNSAGARSVLVQHMRDLPAAPPSQDQTEEVDHG